MTHFLPSELARVSLPKRGERGLLVMLEYYLDDSGTHEGSPVVVWGGIAGHKLYLDQLDAQWRERLDAPCEGKPAIRAFHSYDLAQGIGEFEGYSQAERDLTRYNFRKIIIDCGATVLSYGTSVKDWEQVMHKLHGMHWFSAEQAVLGKAVQDLLKDARKANEPVNLQFDAGRNCADVQTAIRRAVEATVGTDDLVTFGFAPVGAYPALQAADLVVHETYRHFCARLQNRRAKPSAHTVRLFEDAYFSRGSWLGRREIKRAAEKTAAKLKKKS